MDFSAKFLFYLLGTLVYFTACTLARQARIFGGTDAAEGQFPYQALIRNAGRNACGGTIIDERFIVTAAHCVVNPQGKLIDVPLKVVAGVTDLNSESEKQVVVDVEQVFASKDYNPRVFHSLTGDIAVLKLRKDLGISNNFKLGKLELPEGNETFAGVQAVVSGFGLNKVDVVMDPQTFFPREANGEFYGKMRFAEAKVLSQDDCKKFYYSPPSEKQICASLVQRDPKKPEGTCTGDSGGPLAYNNTLIGVISSSPLGCRENLKPALHTRVSAYVDFIRKIVDGKIDNTIRSATLPISDE